MYTCWALIIFEGWVFLRLAQFFIDFPLSCLSAGLNAELSTIPCYILKLVQAFIDLIPGKMLHGLLYHSAIFMCSAGYLFTIAEIFNVRNPKDSLLPDGGSAGLRSHGTLGG